jgi:acyl dehydratase
MRTERTVAASTTYPTLKRAATYRFKNAAEVLSHVGRGLGASEWHDVDQRTIDLFAEATGDHQWIHVDRHRAAQGEFGTTIAHGFLTLSLLPALMAEVVDFENKTMTINYGLNRVRFPAPLKCGSQVRADVTVQHVEEVSQAAQVVFHVVLESDAGPKSVCVAEPVIRVHFR